MTLSEEILDTIASALRLWGNANAESMRKLLRQRLKQTQTESGLAQSIKPNNPTIKGGVVSMAIDLNDYWMYIDLGVKGKRNTSAVSTGSKPTETFTNKDFPNGFKFKTMGYPAEMITNLQDYIARKGIQARVSKDQHGNEVIQTSFQMAESMATAIKLKGIDGTKFYTDTFTDEAYGELTTMLSDIIGQDVEFKLVTELKK
jgi:hypothetical protein